MLTEHLCCGVLKMANEKWLIDANAEIKAIKEYACNDCESHNGIRCRVCWADDWINWIEDAPKVDAVEVVHGRWLYDSGTERHFCSACNEYALSATTQEQVADYDWEENLVFRLEPVTREFWTDYCPNCGAKMDGDGNG